MSEPIVSSVELVEHYLPKYAEFQRLVEQFAAETADFTPGSPNWNRTATALHEIGWDAGRMDTTSLDGLVLEVEFSRDVHPLSVSVDWVLDLERGTFTHSGVVYAILGERVLRDEIAALPDAVADILGVAVFGEVSRD